VQRCAAARQLGGAAPATQRRSHIVVAAKRRGSDDVSDDDAMLPKPGAGLKALWYAAETFGDVLGLLKNAAGAEGAAAATADAQAAASRLPPAARLASLRADYAVDYFISGKGEMAAYDPECVFADPFVAFAGVGRFKKNGKSCRCASFRHWRGVRLADACAFSRPAQ
jgi:hypothetical protein